MNVRLPRAEGRMNAFQRVMYQWSELHPYNAVHAYRIARPLDSDRLYRSMDAVYSQNGIGYVEIGSDGRSYRYERDAHPPLEIIEAGHDAQATLREVFARELNHAYERPRCRPLRISAVVSGAADHYLCVGYDHWAFDSVAARLIVRRILDRYLDLGGPAEPKPFAHYPETYRRAFAPQMGLGRIGRGVIGALGQVLCRRMVCRVPYTSVSHMPVGFALASTQEGTVDGLRQFSRSLGATVHDVVLAALGRSLARHLPRRATRDGTCPVGIGTIVDARGESAVDVSNTLGAFLSYYAVRFAAERDAGLSEVTRRVAALTGPIKVRRGYLDAVPKMKLFSAIWPYLSQRRRPYFVRLVLPMTAGVSNVVIRDPGIDSPGSPIVDYLRGAPTGPLLPLALTVTTFAGRMNLAITYRQTGFTQSRLEDILASVQEQLENLDGTRITRPDVPQPSAKPRRRRRPAAA